MEPDQIEPKGTWQVTSHIPGGLARSDFLAGATQSLVEQEVSERRALSKLWQSDAVHTFKRIV